MNPELSLLIVGCIAEFLLRSTLAFAVCLILNRLVTKASARFIVWAVFLAASAAYWVYLAMELLRHHPAAASSTYALPQTSAAAHDWAAWSTSWSVPQGWSLPLGVALASLGVAYALALFASVLSHANKLRRLRWVMGFATEPPAEITENFQSLCRQLGIRPPRLRVLSGAFSPATFGWARPVVILPALCTEEETLDLEDILLHELHHVRRRDAFWNLLGTTSRALLCFHPAAWYAFRRMRIDRELACDQAVVAHSPSRKRLYAESLLRFARLNVAPEPANWSIDFAAPVDHLTIRVHSILTEARRTAPWRLCLRTAAGLALLAVFVGVAPSLAVLLDYTHPVLRYKGAVADTTTPEAHTAVRVIRKRRGAALPARSIPEAVVTPEAEQAVAVPSPAAAVSTVDKRPDLANGPGPHLQRRGSATPSAKSQSIPLVEGGDTGQSGKHGDAGQAVQQSATIAAAIWKRAGDLDRH